jgi:hypothetical protein
MQHSEERKRKRKQELARDSGPIGWNWPMIERIVAISSIAMVKSGSPRIQLPTKKKRDGKE